jgi:hypothetical protein
MNETETNTDIRTREIKPREWGKDPQATHSWMCEWYSEEEAAEMKRRFAEKQRKQWKETTHGRLCTAFYESFQAYRRYVETNKGGDFTPPRDLAKYDEQQLFEEGMRIADKIKQEREETLRRNLEKAQKAVRCRHVHEGGRQCAAPRVKGKKLCHMHERMEEARTALLDLGPLEDADSIQMAIRKLQRAIIEGKLTPKQVGQLAYTIQLAAWNVTRTSMAGKRLTTD